MLLIVATVKWECCCVQITGVLGCIVRLTSELETNMVAVERTKEYCEIPTEVVIPLISSVD